MDRGPQERKALNIGQVLGYLRSMDIKEPESVPICFSDELPAILAAYDAAQGVLILSDCDEARLRRSSSGRWVVNAC